MPIGLLHVGRHALSGQETVVARMSGCCANTLGSSINIPDGIYMFEAVYTEGGGGDYGEFFVTPAGMLASSANSASGARSPSMLNNVSVTISLFR